MRDTGITALRCSGAVEVEAAVAEELQHAGVFEQAKGKKKQSDELRWTTAVGSMAKCDHMLVLLDERTWTSGEDTAKLVEHIHKAMELGVHLVCVHEFPSVVGPPRHQCEFARMFDDDWTPKHLMKGLGFNIYKEIAIALKASEWRLPGLVALAGKVAANGAEPKPLGWFTVPDTYVPATGPNAWKFD